MCQPMLLLERNHDGKLLKKIDTLLHIEHYQLDLLDELHEIEAKVISNEPTLECINLWNKNSSTTIHICYTNQSHVTRRPEQRSQPLWNFRTFNFLSNSPKLSLPGKELQPHILMETTDSATSISYCISSPSWFLVNQISTFSCYHHILYFLKYKLKKQISEYHFNNSCKILWEIWKFKNQDSMALLPT